MCVCGGGGEGGALLNKVLHVNGPLCGPDPYPFISCLGPKRSLELICIYIESA